MDSTRLHQLFYLRNVLGLGRVVMPAWRPDGESVAVAPASSLEGCAFEWREPCTLLVVGEAIEPSTEPFSGDRGELLKRMIQAMKIDWSNVSLAEWQPGFTKSLEALHAEVRVLKPGAILVFGSAANFFAEVYGQPGVLLDWENTPCLVTLELEHLLRVPQDKKQVWEHLQKLMKALSAP